MHSNDTTTLIVIHTLHTRVVLINLIKPSVDAGNINGRHSRDVFWIAGAERQESLHVCVAVVGTLHKACHALRRNGIAKPPHKRTWPSKPCGNNITKFERSCHLSSPVAIYVSMIPCA